jgi:hypothetical protein
MVNRNELSRSLMASFHCQTFQARRSVPEIGLLQALAQIKGGVEQATRHGVPMRAWEVVGGWQQPG